MSAPNTAQFSRFRAHSKRDNALLVHGRMRQMRWDPDVFAGGNGTVAITARSLTSAVHEVVRNHLQFLKSSVEKETKSSDPGSVKIEDELKSLEETGADLLKEHKGLIGKVKRGSGTIPAATLASIESLVRHFQEQLLIIDRIIGGAELQEDGLDDETYLALVRAMRDTALVVAKWLKVVATRCQNSRGGSDAFEMIRTTNNATSALFRRLRAAYDADNVDNSDDDDLDLKALREAFDVMDLKAGGRDSDASGSSGDEFSD